MRSSQECVTGLREAANALLRREEIERSAARVNYCHRYIVDGLTHLPLEDAKRLLRSVRRIHVRFTRAVQTSGEDEAWAYHLRSTYGLSGLGQLVDTGSKILRERKQAQTRELSQMRRAA